MTDKTVTIWTCDRCGTEKQTNQGDQPHLWAGVMVFHPVKASPDHDRTRRHHLCGECEMDLRTFLNPPQPMNPSEEQS